MSTEEVGAYALLLCFQWNAGSVPADDDSIRRIARVTQAFPLGSLKAKFEIGSDGLLRNARLEKERAKQVAYREKQAINGKMGGRPKGLVNPSLSSGLSQTKAKKSFPSPSPLRERDGDGERKKKAFEKPTIEQIRLLGAKAGLPESEADTFFYHYDSKGWKVGKEPMVSLQSAIGGWATRWRANDGSTQPHLQSGGFD